MDTLESLFPGSDSNQFSFYQTRNKRENFGLVKGTYADLSNPCREAPQYPLRARISPSNVESLSPPSLRKKNTSILRKASYLYELIEGSRL